MLTRCLQRTRWHVTDNMVEAALRWIAQAAAQAIRERGCFHLVLSGGATPRALYERMAGLDADWPNWHIWFGDERCLPAGDEDRNSRMAGKAWLDKSVIPSGQIHVIHAESGSEAAVEDYLRQLQGTGRFDLVLLGLGEDGHTASLFPGQMSESETADVVAVRLAPKPPADRVSLSAQRLSDTGTVLFLVSGKSKREAVQAWQNGAAIPAAYICPQAGVDVLIAPECLKKSLIKV
ncbi:MAG: 6-phosphogluconolactonase [Burkholderiales bacterium]